MQQPSGSAQSNTYDPRARFLLYIYNACEPSRNLLRDLQQLPEDVQLKIEVVNIVDVLETNNYPPTLNCTPCLFVTNTKLPSIHNGRRAILLFFKLRAHDAQGVMDEAEATGRDAVGAVFEKTQMATLDYERDDAFRMRHDSSQLKSRKEFEMLGEPTEASTTSMFSRFDKFIDDPTVGEDPRLKVDPRKIDLDALRSQRGYA
jgi:hypothetical protein